MYKENDLEHVIGKPPGWGMRWGLWVVLAAMALLVLLAAVISYSDVVEAPAMLTTEQPPFRVVAPETRTIGKLLVTDGASLEENTPILLWQTDAEPADVQMLENSLSEAVNPVQLAGVFGNWTRPLRLGSIDPAFIAVRKAARQLLDHQNDPLSQSRLSNLRKQVAEQQALAISLQRQAHTLETELQLAAANVARDSTLLARRSLSESEYDQTRAFYLRKKRELENLQSEIVRNRLLGKQLEAQILDLRQSRASAGKAAQLAFETALLELKTAIESWKNGYLLKAPVSGVVAFPDSRRNGQVLAAGEVILSLVPENGHDARPYCRAWIPAADIAKLKTGMEARIRLEAYPWQQHGELEARIAKLAEVAENGVFEARLSLPNGLATTQGKDLEFHHELQGTVRITTEKRSLLKRLLTKLKWE
ncbi:MAG: hypothetical protein CMN32_12520 [Saprospirales bacterium]|nr:hypothetical protein [Saprospirales bacterium]